MTRKKKIIIGIVIFVVFLGLLGSGSDGNRDSNNSKSETAESTEPQSEEDQIKTVVETTLEGQNNREVARFENIDISGSSEEGYKIEIGFNASDNFGNNLIKTGIEGDMSKLYIALYQSDLNIEEVAIGAHFPMIDQYGNESDKVVYYSVLTKEEADRVNWQADESSLKLSILPQVWETVLLHPEFK
jgi:hypothetical protein